MEKLPEFLKFYMTFPAAIYYAFIPLWLRAEKFIYSVLYWHIPLFNKQISIEWANQHL